MAKDQSPVDKLYDIAFEFGETIRSFSRHLERKEYHLMALDVSAFTAGTTQLLAITPGIAALATNDAATQEATDQGIVDAAAGPFNTALAALVAAAPKAPAADLTVAPVSFTVAGGQQSTPLSVTGGVGPFTVTGLPAGVTSDGVNVSDDGSAVAGTTTATVTDSSPTPLTGPLSVSVV